MRHFILALAIIAIFAIVYNGRCGRITAMFSNPVAVDPEGYENQPWHTGGKSLSPQYGDVIDAPGDNLLINNANYQEGTAPTLDSDPSDGHRGRTTTRDALPVDDAPPSSAAAPNPGDAVDNFWYDTNAPGDTNDTSSKYNDFVTAEAKYQNSLALTRHPLTTDQQVADTRSAAKVEGFSHNRAPPAWNEIDYPIVTSNNLNLTPLFSQSATVPLIGYDVLEKIWGSNIDNITK